MSHTQIRSSSNRSRIACLIILLHLMALLGAIVLPSSAEAYLLNGCKFPGSNPNIEIKYMHVTDTYKSATNTAQNRWDADTPNYGGYFTVTTGSDPEIKVYDSYYSETWYAIAAGGCDSGGGQEWYNDLVLIKYNFNTMDDLSSSEKIQIGIHELGHALGLAHSYHGCSSPGPAVMKSDALYGLNVCGDDTAPFQDDIDGVENIYD